MGSVWMVLCDRKKVEWVLLVFDVWLRVRLWWWCVDLIVR